MWGYEHQEISRQWELKVPEGQQIIGIRTQADRSGLFNDDKGFQVKHLFPVSFILAPQNDHDGY